MKQTSAYIVGLLMGTNAIQLQQQAVESLEET